MAAESPKRGELVRYWDKDVYRIGKVLQTGGKEIRVKPCSGVSPVSVATDDLESYVSFVMHQERGQKLKTVYAEFFGGKPLKRMPQKDLQRLFHILLEEGIGFDETLSTANDYFRLCLLEHACTDQQSFSLTKRVSFPQPTAPSLVEGRG